jgi:hypothetical protein
MPRWNYWVQRQDQYHSQPYFAFPRNSKLWRFGLYFWCLQEVGRRICTSCYRFLTCQVPWYAGIQRHHMELPLLYRNAHLWLQVLLNHFCLGGCRLVNHDGCIFELKSFVDTLQVACAWLKMHHAWAIFASTEDYLSRFPHMTQLW